MDIENVLVKNLKGYEKNAKKHPTEQIDRIHSTKRKLKAL